MNSLPAPPEPWRKHRLLISVVTLIIFLLITGQTATFSRHQAMDALQAGSQADLNRYVISLQQKLDRYKELPSLLSTHSLLQDALRQPDSADARSAANVYLEYVANTVAAADVYLMNVQGTTAAASNWAEPRSFVGKNYSFRPYFQDAMQGKPGRYFALGTVSKKRGYYFSYPVYFRDRIIGVAVVKIELNEIEGDWSAPQQHILVTDEDGVVFISTRKAWKFRTLNPLSPQAMKRIVDSLRYGDRELHALDIVERQRRPDASLLITLVEGNRIDNAALDGVSTHQYLLQSRQLPESGLTVVILASTLPVQHQVFNAVTLAVVVFVALALLVLFLLTKERGKRERERFKQHRTETLQENETRIRGIIDNTQAGLITLDEKGRIESFNTTAERLFGYTEMRIRHQYFSTLLSQADRHACWQHITTPDAERKPELFIEASGQRADSSRFPIELIIGQMQTGGIKRFIITIHDITERKLYELKLQRAHTELESRVASRTVALTDANEKLMDEVEQHRNTQNELIQTAKLAVLGQMSAGINHELNQPLTAIRAYADNARAFLEMGKTEVAVTNLKEIGGLTERMAKIIHPLKEFSRKSSGQPEPVCLRAVRDGAMAVMYGRLNKQGAQISWPDTLDQLYVMADIVRLEQVMVNLISNGLQAMESVREKRIEIAVQTQADQLIIRVRDFGPGISDAELDQVFEPFFTTKQAGQGLGLGLSISHRIIENLNGRLRADNHPRGGAVFIIELPLATVCHK
ncbi:MAG: ATP-binding protein [Pontibacterium sp.]